MVYDARDNIITGIVPFNLHYYDEPTIKDSYSIRIDLSRMNNRQELPLVYNPDGRIIRTAHRKHKEKGEFHINGDNTLCLMLPERFSSFYPNGFTIQEFMRHLCNHLYWVSYMELYDKEPWPAEKHGYAAIYDFFRNEKNIDIIVGDKHLIEEIRFFYKKKFGKGIAKYKLKRLIKRVPSFLEKIF